MNKIFYIIVLAGFCFLQNAEAKLFNATSFELKNGLEVVVIPNHKAPIIKQMLWYKVGSIDEPLGKGGTAHLLEHLMFRGTKNVKDSEFNDIVALHGADANAFTSDEVTAYHEFADISRLEVMMALEADRMANLEINDDAFDKERKIVFQERQQRVVNNPAARFAEIMERTLWQDSPYARPVTGTEAEIMSINKSDVEAFYNRYYTPDNAVLVLSGDIDVKTAMKLTKKYFGKIDKRMAFLSSKQPSAALTDKQSYRVESQMREIKTPRLVKSYVVPSLPQNSKEAYALMVFAKYFGDGYNSFLYDNYVLSGQVVAASSSYSALRKGPGVFSVSVYLSGEQDIDKGEEILNTSVEEALKQLTAERLETEKQKMLSGLVYIQDNPEDAAMLAGQMLALGMGLSDIENYEENLKAVSLEDIQSAVNKMLRHSTDITGLLLPYNTQESSVLPVKTTEEGK